MADHFLGTWKLNVAKSKYSPGPAPKSFTIKQEDWEGGLKFASDGIDAKGNPTHGEYSAKFDGKDYPMKGNPIADTVSPKRIDAYTVESVLKKGGKVVLNGRAVVSRDGKTLTLTETGKNAQGQEVNNIRVSEKQ